MDNIVEFTVNERPFPKGRPRFRRCGSFVSTYTPKTTLDYEKKIREAFKQACPIDMSNYEGTVRIYIQFIFKPNKSLSKKKNELLIGKPHVSKPDTDNLIKSCLDGLNKVAFKDDSQIYEISSLKRYGEEDSVNICIYYEG